MIEEKPSFKYVPIEKLKLWEEGNVRKVEILTNIEELASNIAKIGLRLPLLVKKFSEEKYGVFSGQRRLKACEMAGIKYVPCLVFETISAQQARLISLSENLYRQPMNDDDISNATYDLLQKLKTREKVAIALGQSVNKVKKYLGYKRLPEELKDVVREKKITPQQAIDIFSKFPEEKKAVTVAKELGSIKTRGKKAKLYHAIKTSATTDDLSTIRKSAEKLEKTIVYEIILPDFKAKLLEKIALQRKVTVEDILQQIIDQWTDRYERGLQGYDV